MSELNKQAIIENKVVPTAENVLDWLSAGQQTYEESKAQFDEEQAGQGGYDKIETIRFNKSGTIEARILPLPPTDERKGWEYPVHKTWIAIPNTNAKGEQVVDKNGKPMVTNVMITRPDYWFKDLKFTDDLLRVYGKLAKAEFKSRLEDVKSGGSDPAGFKKDELESLIKNVDEGSYNNPASLKYDYKRVAYAFDLSDKSKVKMIEFSNAQFKDVEERKLSIWDQLKEENPDVACPLCSPRDGRKLKITGKADGKKTKYIFEVTIKREALTIEDGMKLVNTPSLPSVLYPYTRRQFEATLAFLSAYDKRYMLGLMENQTLVDAIEKIKALIPDTDDSHFEQKEAKSSSEEEGAGAYKFSSDMPLEDLLDVYEQMKEDGLEESDEEMRELRGVVKGIIKEEDAGIKITSRKTTKDLIEELIEFLDAPEKEEKDEDEEDDDASPASTAPRSTSTQEDDEDTDEEEEDRQEAKPARSSRRVRR